MPKPYKPVTHQEVYVSYEGFEENPFETEGGQQLIHDVCGTIRIPRANSHHIYDADRKVAIVYFHFTSSKWAAKAAQRAAMLKGAIVTVLDAE